MNVRMNSSRHSKRAACALSAFLLTVPLVGGQTVHAEPINTLLTPVTGDSGWLSAGMAVNGDSFSFDVSGVFPQFTGPVTVTASSSKSNVATATAANGRIEVRVKEPGVTRLAITGSDSTSLALTDYVDLNVTLLGDTTGDGLLTSADVLYIYKVINSKLPITDQEKNRLDVNRDGVITTADATVLMNSYVGKTPATGGVKFIAELKDSNDAPVADKVAITGTVQTGSALTGGYRYADPENDAEGATLYQWYRGTLADGSDKAPIAGGITTTYTVQDADVDHYLFFEVTPVDWNGAAGSAARAGTIGLVPDTSPPVVTGTTPVALSNAASRTEQLQIVFNEPIKAAAGKSIHIYRASDNQPVTTYLASDTSKVTVTGTKAVLVNPGLGNATAYYVTIDAGAFTDLVGNPFGGISGSSGWGFTTVDTEGPVTAALSPANGAADANKASNFTLTLDENVQAVSGKKITILNADHSELVSYDAADASKVTINGKLVTIHNPGLAETTSYSIEVEAGALTDLSGNNFAGINGTDWSFATPDTIAPVLHSTTPADDASGVNRTADISMEFSEPVQAVNGKTVRIYRASDNSLFKTYNATDANAIQINSNTVTLLNPNLADGADFYVEIDAGAFRDAAGNNYAGLQGILAWNFSTPDTIAPVASSFNPTGNSTGVELADKLTVTFSEPVVPVNGKTVKIVNAKDQTEFAVYTFGSDSEVSVSGDTLTIQHAPFDALKGYVIQIEAGAVKDAAGNPFAGVSDWTFTSKDTREMLAAVDPGAPLVEGILNAGVFVTLTLTGDTFLSDVDMNDFALNHAPAGLSIIGAGVLPDGSAYVMFDYDGTDFDTDITDFSVKASSSAVASGHAITSQNLTIKAEIEPNVINTVPAAGATKVKKADPLTMTFDKNVTAAAGKKITIYKKADNSVVETIDAANGSKVSVNGSTVTIQHNAFTANTEYYAVVEAGAFVDVSLIGNKTVSAFAFKTTSVEIVPEMYISEFLRGSDSQIAIELYAPTAAPGGDKIPANTYSVSVYRYDTKSHTTVVSNYPIAFEFYKNMPFIFIDRTFYDFFDVTHATYYNDEVIINDPDKILKAIVLKRGTQSIDVLGDPTETGPGGLLASGKTLVRKSGVNGASIEYDEDQWNVYPAGSFQYMGNHTP
ncbi:Ig-like domain-containing protein [Paenibacillus glycanilyticus]|uniref:Ig-like domain-containing protein n=1 Tax=Paenibacillus glycanilyticus TaxID=126569 RepID=UPI0019100F43|nr:Ig-like domain-containing protein [Paenibacillus glycanilyticus]